MAVQTYVRVEGTEFDFVEGGVLTKADVQVIYWLAVMANQCASHASTPELSEAVKLLSLANG